MNSYTNQFINETRKIDNNSGLIGRLNEIIKSNNSDKVDQFSELMNNKLKEIETKKKDRFKFNKDAQVVKKLLTIQNSYLRRQKLNEYLYFSNFIKQ